MSLVGVIRTFSKDLREAMTTDGHTVGSEGEDELRLYACSEMGRRLDGIETTWI